MVAKTTKFNPAIEKSMPLVATLIDSVIIGLTFLLACDLLSAHFENMKGLITVAYIAVNLIAVHLSRQLLLTRQSTISPTISVIIGNALGLAIGAVILIFLQYVFFISQDSVIAVLLAEIMAFFVLGTVAPLIRFHLKPRYPVSN